MLSIRVFLPVPRASCWFIVALLVGTIGVAPLRADALEDVLVVVPEDAVAWMVSPNLSRLNGDLSDLIDRADRPELAVAGRPMDVIVSQFGLAVGFDERGSFALWSPSVDDLLEGAGVAAVPVEDAKRFLEGNFDPAPEAGDGAVRTRDGILLFTRTTETHVLLAPRRDLVQTWQPGVGRARLVDVFGPDVQTHVDAADLLLRIAGRAVTAAQRFAMDRQADMDFEGAPVDRERLQEVFDSRFGGASDILVAVDADALALGVRGWTVYAPDSTITNLSKNVSSTEDSILASLPGGPFYVALGIDFDRFGGQQAFEILQSMATDLDLPLDSAFSSLAEAIRSMAFVARPSKLGLAMGGMLNDASLSLVGRNGPASLRDSIESAMRSMDGVSGAVERDIDFERSVEQRRGGVADEITMKMEIAPADRREDGARVGDASIQLTAERMLYGPRGLLGLGRVVDDAYVVTFSRRPDVMKRAAEAVGGVDSLADDPVVIAISEWLPPRPGFVLMLDVGRLSTLARQVVSMIPNAANAIPQLPDSMPPVAAATTLSRTGESGRLDWGVVIPAEVIGASIGAAISEAIRPAGQGDAE